MKISRLFVLQDVAGHPLVLDIQNRLRIPPELVTDPSHVYEDVLGAKDPMARGKKVLFLTNNKGGFLKDCPGTRNYTCCGYRILHVGTYCSMDCAYCILQVYFHPPVLQFFVNHDQMLAELDQQFQKPFIERFGTGEYTDSLIWENITRLCQVLVPKFAGQPFRILELKTKTASVDALAGLDHNRKTICAWSLNTPAVIAAQERGTASLDARLRAAAKCQAMGYPVAFHFDPMIVGEKSEDEAYGRVVDRLFQHISPENIAWISLGAFRFIAPLKPLIQTRFPFSKIVYGEFVKGLDGKFRYFSPLRIRLYEKMVARIRKYDPNACIYLCMESDKAWQNALGFLPEEKGGLCAMLDRRAGAICGLDIKNAGPRPDGYGGCEGCNI